MAFGSLGRLAAYAGMAVAITAVSGITTALIAEKAVAPDLRKQLLCTAGYTDLADTACVSEQIAALRLQTEAQLQAANEARELAEHALVGRMIFEEGPTVAGLTIIVGTTYRDHAARTGFVRAICWGIHDRGGLDPRVTLAQMGPDGQPTPVIVDAFEQSSLGVGAHDVEAARIACPWPGVS